MKVGLASRLNALPTAAKLLLFISAALLPLGLALVWLASNGIRDANEANQERAQAQGVAATRAIESLIARETLALRIAANSALRLGSSNPCEIAVQSLALSPGVANTFALRDPNGRLLCTVGDFHRGREDVLIA